MDQELNEIIEEKVEEVEEVKPKRERKRKQYEITNRENRPYEFHIINDWYRLEPRNKEGDTIILNEDQINSIDFQICSKHVIVKEA